MEQYVIKDGKKLRYGYTTGSCATAASKAALYMLLHQEQLDHVEIETPKGWDLNLLVHCQEYNEDYAIAAIKKDSGDDPDITHGILVYSKVRFIEHTDERVVIKGGVGVGVVTKPGLSVKVGQPAINPTPLKMIREAVLEILPENKSLEVTIFIPEGVEAAKKTFNEKLGIIGGISVLGTSGIVEPMSNEAFRKSLALELSILKEQGRTKAVFCPGNYGIRYAKGYGVDEKEIIRTSNFIGFMIEQAVHYGFNEVLFIGHIGKLIKVAGGIFDTHSRVADARLEILAANCIEKDVPMDICKRVLHSNTTEEAVEILLELGYSDVFQLIAEKVKQKCEEKSRGAIKFNVITFSLEAGVLGQVIDFKSEE